jgi:signal-transduction protein with cAMP-binding, CBS, and nucleotidyltransferase domain
MSTHAFDVLSERVLRVDSAAPLSETLIEIRRKRASHVAVFSQGECLGVSTLGDTDPSTEASTSEELVNRHPCPVVSEATSLDELGRVFADANVEAQVVHDDQGESSVW